jgi:hypothetical protein
MTRKSLTITAAKIIPWEKTGQWGLAIVYSDGRESTYRVGTRAQAEAEVRRLSIPQH